MDRRDFIKKSAIISATATLAPSLVSVFGNVGCSNFSGTGLDEGQVARLLKTALERGGDFSEVFIEELGSFSFKLSEGVFSETTAGILQGIGIRTVDGVRNGYSYVNGLDYGKAIEAAKVSAYISSGAGGKEIAVPVNAKDPGKISVAVPLESISESRKMELMKMAEVAARDYHPDIKQVDITYVEQTQKRRIANSNGHRIANEIPLIWVVIEVLGERGGVRHGARSRISAHQGFEFFETNDVIKAAKDAAREAIVMLDAKPSPSGTMPVVMKAGWGGVLIHEAVGHGLEGDVIYRGTSIYSDKLGQKVASDLVTMVDDSSWPNARGTTGFDDEGTIGKRNVLIEKGILKGFMHDLISAGQLKMEPSGNGRRDNYRSIPIPRMTNTFLDNGESKPEDIISSTKKGIYIAALSGGSVDTISGQFNFIVREAYMIEKGKITYPVMGATLIGRGIDVLTNINAVGNDLELGVGICGKGQWVPVTAGLPTLRVASGITVGGSA